MFTTGCGVPPGSFDSDLAQAIDPFVVGAEIVGQDTEDRLDIEAVGCRHVFEIRPVPRAAENALKTARSRQAKKGSQCRRMIPGGIAWQLRRETAWC